VSNLVKQILSELIKVSSCFIVLALSAGCKPKIEVYTIPPVPPRLVAPEHWEEKPTSRMLEAEKQRFEISMEMDDNDTVTALATLTVLPGSGDRRNRTEEEYKQLRQKTLRLNVDRWRGQLQLKPLPEEAVLEDFMKPVEGLPEMARMIDLNGTAVRPPFGSARTLGVMIPRVNSLWVYKLSGDARVVERERNTFLKLLPLWH
tara:strand:- start:1654 stop:2262 length:609 start_codon:yes stop_codon:yes gene_type:complete